MARFTAVADALIPMLTPKTASNFLTDKSVQRRVRVGTRHITSAPLNMESTVDLLDITTDEDFRKKEVHAWDDVIDPFLSLSHIHFEFYYGVKHMRRLVPCVTQLMPESGFTAASEEDLKHWYPDGLPKINPLMTKHHPEPLMTTHDFMHLNFNLGQIPSMKMVINGTEYRVGMKGSLRVLINLRNGILLPRLVSGLELGRVKPMPNVPDLEELMTFFSVAKIAGIELSGWRRNPRRMFNL